MDTRVKIDINNGLIELEGSESFVEKYLERYEKQFLTPTGYEKVSNTLKTELIQSSPLTTKKTKKSNSGGLSITATEFDYEQDGETESLEKFLESKSPGSKSNTSNFICTVGYYIQIKREMGSFTEGNIEFAYRVTEQKGRPNFLRQTMINMKNSKVLLEEVEGNKGEWRLTRKGEIYVEEKMNLENKK